MIDFVAAVRSESARFAALIRSTPMDAPVPCCPDWRFADLVWHLGEVQSFWASIVEGLLDDPEGVTPPERPEHAGLGAFFERQSARLAGALARRDPEESCWSWAEGGSSVGWVRRRQAHEALVHRVDAEQTAGTMTPVDRGLAADGIDEILRYSIDVGTLADWARYDEDGTTALIQLADGSRSWALTLGRFRGTSTATGNSYDLPAARLVDAVDRPSAVLRGAAPDLDLWLWGRGPLDPITVIGDPGVAGALRETARDATR